MRCHYENVEGVGKVLIPGCMAVAVSNDINMCTCSPNTIRQFEAPGFKKEIERLTKIIRDLEKENNFYADLLERSGVVVKYK